MDGMQWRHYWEREADEFFLACLKDLKDPLQKGQLCLLMAKNLWEKQPIKALEFLKMAKKWIPEHNGVEEILELIQEAYEV
jgi:hypothetical protein